MDVTTFIHYSIYAIFSKYINIFTNLKEYIFLFLKKL